MIKNVFFSKCKKRDKKGVFLENVGKNCRERVVFSKNGKWAQGVENRSFCLWKTLWKLCKTRWFGAIFSCFACGKLVCLPKQRRFFGFFANGLFLKKAFLKNAIFLLTKAFFCDTISFNV